MSRGGRFATTWAHDIRIAQKFVIFAAVIALAVLVSIRGEHAVQALAPARFTPSDPLDERALAALGFQADRQGERTRARALIDLAGRRSWRDPQAQAWLLQRAVESGDWAGASAHADALLRIDGDGVLRPAVFRLLDVIAADEAARPALVERLRHRPWWRESWLAHLTQAAASTTGAISPDDARSIVMSLGSGTGRLSEAEYLPYVEMRLARGDFLAARRDWSALANRSEAEALLRDPTFQTLGKGAPFDWRRASGVGASSDVEATGDGGRALRVDYDGVSSPVLPGQLIVLPSGRYTFAWRERIAGPPQIVWRIRCLGRGPRILAQNSPIGAAGWRTGALTFEVTRDCPAQELELVPLPGERREDVTDWFAGLALSRNW